MVIKMPLKFKVKILKICKLAPLWSRDLNLSIKFFPNNLPKDILLTLRKFGEPPKVVSKLFKK